MNSYLQKVLFLKIFLLSCFFIQNSNAQNSLEKELITADSLRRVAQSQGDIDQAIIHAKHTLVKVEALHGSKDTLYGKKLLVLANLYYQNYDFNNTLECRQEAVSIFKSYPTHKLYPHALSLLADVCSDIGEFDQAEQYFLQANETFIQNGQEKSSNRFQMFNSWAIMYHSLGEYEKAQTLYIKAKELAQELYTRASDAYIYISNNLSLVYIEMRMYEEAATNYQELINLSIEVYGKDHPQYARILFGLGGLYANKGEYSNAQKYFLDAEKVYESASFIDEKYAHLLTNIANTYCDLGDYASALPYYNKSIDWYKKNYGMDAAEYLMSLQNLAVYYAETKSFDKAFVLYNEVLNSYKKSSSNRWEYIDVLNDIGGTYFLQEDYANAENYYWQSILSNLVVLDEEINLSSAFIESLVEKTFFDISLAQESLHGLHDVWTKEGGDEKQNLAYVAMKTILAMNEETRKSFHSAENKAWLLAGNTQYAEMAIAKALEIGGDAYMEEAFGIAEQNKSMLLADVLQEKNAYIFGDLPDSLIAKEQVLSELLTDIEIQILNDPSKANMLLNQRNDLLDDIGLLKQEMEKEYPKYYELKYSNNNINIAQLQATLDNETALIEYFIANDKVYIFTITQNAFDVTTKLITYQELAQHTQSMRQGLSNYIFIKNNEQEAYNFYTNNAYWFYNELVEPALPESINTLVIIPDGILGYLPFETFLTNTVQPEMNYSELPYLINDYTISYSYSAYLWMLNNDKEVNHNGKILAFAPTYENNNEVVNDPNRSNAQNNLRKYLTPLPAAQQEVEQLEELYKGTFLYNNDATEKKFKAESGDYGIIHLAMHGLLNAGKPMLSSMAFTEDGDSSEDNFLQAWEISKMDLEASLVVLSACETGFGRFEQGEGILSIARSFMYAGTPSLVVSMWEVNDMSTARIMEFFYANLATKMDKDAALRQAKLSYIKEAKGLNAHPAYWSPFIQLGNTNAVHLKSRGFWALWRYIGVGLAIMIGFFIMRKYTKRLQ